MKKMTKDEIVAENERLVGVLVENLKKTVRLIQEGKLTMEQVRQKYREAAGKLQGMAEKESSEGQVGVK